jgi:peptidyl-prolyl cis-trans isomerase C
MSHGCGSGGPCGCSGGAQTQAQPSREVAQPESRADIAFAPRDDGPSATVNGLALHAPGYKPDAEALRQRTYVELLRQAAQRAGLLAEDDVPGFDGVPSEAASSAIEELLDRNLDIPEPEEAACRRHHAAHAAHYRSGEKLRARHILFAVTPGVEVGALRKRAEAALLDVRCHDGNPESAAADRFAVAARSYSNCPSAERGGDLGWLTAEECAPEFARELFGHADVGVLPRLVHSRFGLHVVEVLERDVGDALPFEAVQGKVAASLRKQAYVTALRQYLRLLAGEAVVSGVDLEAADSPLVQ